MPQKSWSFQPFEESTSPSKSGWSFVPFEIRPEKSYWEEFKSDVGDYFKDTFQDPFKTKYPGEEGFDPDEAAKSLAESSRKIFEPFTDVGSRMGRDLAAKIPKEYDFPIPLGPTPFTAPVSKFVEGASDIIGGQLSPGAIGMLGSGTLARAAFAGIPRAATPAAAMAGYRTARNLDNVSRALSTGYAVEGADTMLDPESTWLQRGEGALQTGLGLLGIRQGIPDLAGGPRVSGGPRGGGPSVEPLGLPPYEPPGGPSRGGPSAPPPPSPGWETGFPPSASGKPNVVDIKDPIVDLPRYKAEGYVTMPGMRSPEGYPQMVHNSVAQLYRNAGPPPVTPRPAAPKPDIPGPIGPGQQRAGKTVPIQNKNVNESLRQKMKDNGYVEVSRGPTHTLFERLIKEDQGAIPIDDLTEMKVIKYLWRMLKREPTPQEVQTVLARQRRPTEPSGRVAPFKTRYELDVEQLYAKARARGIDPEGMDPGELSHILSEGGGDPYSNATLPPTTYLPKGGVVDEEEVPPVDEWPVKTTTTHYDTPNAANILRQEIANYESALANPELKPDGTRKYSDAVYEQDRRFLAEAKRELAELEARQASVQELPPSEAPPRGRGIFHPAEGGGRLVRGGPGTVSEFDRPVPPPAWGDEPQLPGLMGRQPQAPTPPLETDIQLQNDIEGVRAANRFKRAFEAPAEQLSMEPQMKDAEIAQYLEGESATPPEMVDLPPRDEPSFERNKDDDEGDRVEQMKKDATELGIDWRLYDDPEDLRDAIVENIEQAFDPETRAALKAERDAAAKQRNFKKMLKGKFEEQRAKGPETTKPNDPPEIRKMREELRNLTIAPNRASSRMLTEREAARVETLVNKLEAYDNFKGTEGPSHEKPKGDRDVDELMQLRQDAEDNGIDWRLYDDMDELNDAILEKTEQYLTPESAARAKMEREAATKHRNDRKAIKQKLQDMLAKTPDRPRPNDPPVIRALRAELHKLMNVAGKYGIRGLSEKEMARVEQIQEKLFAYDNMQDADVPYHAKVKGGGLKINADIKRAATNLTKDYTGELAAIMLREMGQNGGDAAEKLGVNGIVRIRVSDTDQTDNGEKTIEVHDNGSGLDEYGLAEKLVKLFASGKEDDPTATGGKGIGSASYLLGGKHVIIDTIAVDANDMVDEDGNVTRKADGKKYRIIASGTPEQFLSKQGSDWEVEEVDPLTPTGTTVTVTLKDDQDTGDAVDMLRNIRKHTRNKPYMLIFDEFGIMTKGVPIAEMRAMGTLYSDGDYFKKSVEDKTIGELEFQNNKINIQLPTFDETVKNDHAEIHYLNNGMYQFSDSVSISDADIGFPPVVLVNIEPQVDEEHDDYPFINTREDVKKDVRAEVDRFIKEHLKDPAVSKRKNRVQELYDSMTFVDIGARRRTVIYDPGLRMTPQETAIFAKSPTIRRLLIHYDHLLDSIIASTGNQDWADRLEGIGIALSSTDIHGFNGIHIPNPRTGKSTILINPFLRASTGVTAEDNAWLNTITNLHEVAHIGRDAGKNVYPKPSDFYLTPEDMKDPRLMQRNVDFFASFVNQAIDHGDVGWFSTGHGADFIQRLGEVYAAFGPRNAYKSAEKLEAIFTGGDPLRGYSPEFQRLLYIYTDSRGRDETTEDFLSGTGVKQENRESDREGNVSGTGAPDGARASWPERIKKATGWGQGSVAADMDYGVIREAIAFFTNATTMLDFGGLTRQGLGMLLTREYPMGAISAFRALTYGGMQKVNAGLKAKDIMHEPINEVTGDREKSFAEKEMGLPLFTPASEEGMRTEQTASKILEVGFGKDVLSTIYKHTAGYPIRATNRFHITLQNYMKITRAQRLVDQLVNISRVAGETGRGRRTDMLGSLGVTRKYSEEEALDLNPYHNKQRAREIGDFVRTAIGQAPYKVHVLPSKYTHLSLESAAKVLSGVMFSPGLFFSRARLLSPSTYVMATPFVRKQYLRSLLSVAAGWFLFTSMIKMYLEANDEDGEVGDDMTSADAGKVRVGNTRMDAGGGFLQFLVTYARLWYGGSTSSATGTYHRAGSGYQAQTNESMLERFAVNKLNPFYKFAYDLGNASEYNPFHVGDRTLQLFTSLLVQDLISLHDENPDLVPGLGPAAAIGLGTQTYEHGESQGKLIAPENDWLVTGGGIRDLMPWNWNVSDQEKTNFPWQE